MNPPSIILGGGVHGKACWLIAYKYSLSHHDWHLDMNRLVGKVRLKNQKKSIYSKSCQDTIELCEIRDGSASCDALSNDDICKIINIICIE